MMRGISEEGKGIISSLKAALKALRETGDWWAVKALRDGLVSTLPIIVLGSLFLLVSQLGTIFHSLNSIPTVKLLMVKALGVHKVTLKILSLYLAFTMASSVARYLEVPQLSSSLLSVALFLLLSVKVEAIDGKTVLDIKNLSSEGIFLAILSGWLTVGVVKLFDRYRLDVKGMPKAVLNSINSLLPGGVVLLIGYLVSLTGLNLSSLLSQAIYPLKYLGDSLLAVIAVNLLIHLLWFFGLHGVSIVDAVMLSLWLGFLQANAEAAQAGIALPYVTAHPFWQWFIWIGGSGAGLSLWLACLIAGRSETIRETVKLSAPTIAFNINEPLIFGLPVVMNYYLLIPFILVPILNGVIAFSAIKMGLVRAPFAEPPWVLPNPIGVLMATGFDMRALVLVIVEVIIDTLIYLPFVRYYDLKLRNDSHA